MNAQNKYEQRRAVHRKLIRYPEIMAAVRDGFDAGWSPEQIAGRMRLERHPMHVSHETIFRYAYSKDGRAEKFYQHLPRHRRNRRPRGMRKHHGRKFLLRRYLPRRSDPTTFSSRYLKSICDRLNATPRKCLGYQTPAEVFRVNLMEGASSP